MSFEQSIREALQGAGRVAVMGVGDELHADDVVGLAAARSVADLRIPDVDVLIAGGMPENHTGVLRRARPTHVVVLDAADMGEPPGTAAIIAPGSARGQRYSTHALPLSVVAEYVEQEIGARVLLVGIQPSSRPEHDARAVADALAAALGRRT